MTKKNTEIFTELCILKTLISLMTKFRSVIEDSKSRCLKGGKMKSKSMIKNAVFNFLYTGMNLLFPLISAPYVSKVLGAANLGKVNLANSFVNWFIIFAVFGTTSYGVREVAKIREDRDKLNILFSEIIIINGIFSLITAVVYFIVIFNVDMLRNEIVLYSIMSLSIILNIFSIDWFYQGIEEYSYITTRSGFFKLLSLVSIFVFIKKTDHYMFFGLISVLSISLSGVLNYFYSKKYVNVQFQNIHPFKHVKKLRVFFIHTLIISLYTNLDQTLLGFLVNTKSVAFMSRGKQITSMAIAISTSISNVTLPRASYYIANNKPKFVRLLSVIPKYILWFSIPITVGCILLSPNIMYILGGNEFLEASELLQIMSLIIIFAPLSSFLQNQVLIPTGNEKLGVLCALITSLISILLNLYLIPKYSYIGAAVTLVISEISAVVIRVYIIGRNLRYTKIRFINKSILSYLISSAFMALIVILISRVVDNLTYSFIISSFSGFLVYVLTLIMMKEETTMYLLNKFKNNKKYK